MKKNRYKKENKKLLETAISASIIALVVFIGIFCFLIELGNSAEIPDYDYPISGWTTIELKTETMKCVSERLSTVQTEYAAIMLESICYYNVINSGKKE